MYVLKHRHPDSTKCMGVAREGSWIVEGGSRREDRGSRGQEGSASDCPTPVNML
jgi:hypothetical protein